MLKATTILSEKNKINQMAELLNKIQVLTRSFDFATLRIDRKNEKYLIFDNASFNFKELPLEYADSLKKFGVSLIEIEKSLSDISKKSNSKYYVCGRFKFDLNNEKGSILFRFSGTFFVKPSGQVDTFSLNDLRAYYVDEKGNSFGIEDSHLEERYIKFLSEFLKYLVVKNFGCLFTFSDARDYYYVENCISSFLAEKENFVVD